MDIDLVKSFLHGCKVNLVDRVCKMPSNRSYTARHFRYRNLTNLPFTIYGIGTDKKLVTLFMDQATSRSASTKLWPFLNRGKIRSYLE